MTFLDVSEDVKQRSQVTSLRTVMVNRFEAVWEKPLISSRMTFRTSKAFCGPLKLKFGVFSRINLCKALRKLEGSIAVLLEDKADTFLEIQAIRGQTWDSEAHFHQTDGKTDRTCKIELA